MAPSLALPMTPSPSATQNKRPRRIVPIIPAIPRNLEKRKFKEDVKSSKDGEGSASPIRPNSRERKEESQEETAVTQTQAVQSGTLNGYIRKDDAQENGVSKAIVEALDDARSETEIATGEGKSTISAADGSNLSPVHARDFGIEKHGNRLPPPFYPKPSPPPAISTDFSSANEEASVSETTSQTVEEENSSNGGQPSSAVPHTTLNAAAPTFHAHPIPPTDVTSPPTESSYKGYDHIQSITLQPEPTPPTDATLSPTEQSFQGNEATQSISFYAPPQSPSDPSSPNHSVYQGYAYAPASYGYSPHSHAFQQPIDSPHRTEASISYEKRHMSQPPCYSNDLPCSIAGRQSPLTPSRTPLDPLAQPWSYSNGPPPTMSFDYGYMHSCYPQPTIKSRVRSTSQESLKSDESARKDDFIDDRPEPIQLNTYENKTAGLITNAHRRLDDCMSSHVPLVEYLLQQFNVEEYADCQLTLVHENLRFLKTTWSLSSLLLAGSRKLRDLLKSTGLNEDGKRRLEIRLTDRFVTPWAMNSALRVLYGDRPQMLTLDMISSSTFDTSAESWVFQMDACLAFAAAGHVLGLENVVSHGLQVASFILDWDSLEHALSFGLESGPSRGHSASVDVIPLSSYSPACLRGIDPSSTLNLTPPSSSAESRPERSGQPGSRDEAISSISSSMAEVHSALDLQMHCLQWMASNLDEFWLFDPSARPLAEVDRLPTTAESRSPLFKSRLSRIQFGDHPSEMHAQASDRNLLVSSIVLSLPFMALKYVLDVGTQPILRQLHTIVKERERRRQVVLLSKSVPWSQRLAAREHEWAEVGFTEWVDTTGDEQVTLARTFTGIDRQVSEPCTPDQQKR